MCIVAMHNCWCPFSAVEKGLKQVARGKERDRLKWIQLQLFKVLTGVVEENLVDCCAVVNKHLEQVLHEGPEKVSMTKNVYWYKMIVKYNIILLVCLLAVHV